jgi:predicted MFS family arabinose efflux permease
MVASQFGWRAVMILVGMIGMVMAPIAWLTLRGGRSNPHGASAASESAQWADFAALLRKRSVLFTMVGAAMIATGSYSMNAFGAAFFMRVHKLSVADTGLWLGMSAGILGMVVLLAGGALADRLSRHNPRWLLRVVACLQMAALPLAVGAFLIGNVTVAIVCFALSTACMNSYIAPTVAALYRLVLPGMRARTSAVLLFMTAVLGGAGPFMVGLLSDRLQPTFGVEALRHALLLVPVFSVAATLFYLAAAARFNSELIEAKAT